MAMNFWGPILSLISEFEQCYSVNIHRLQAKTLIIFQRNASFWEYYVFISNAATAAFATVSQFCCQRDNFWRIYTTFFKLDTCITHPNILDEFDNWHCRPHPKNVKSSISIWNVQKCDWTWIWDTQNDRSIWNSQKCDWKWFLDIQNGRRKQKNSYRSEMARNAIESDFRTSKMATSAILSKI